jgi:tetratricopeptide (TPR) repeat protein
MSTNRAAGLALAAVLWSAGGAARAQDPTPPDAPPADTAPRVEAARKKAAELTAAGKFAEAEKRLDEAEKALGPSAALTTARGSVRLAQSKKRDAEGADEATVVKIRGEAAALARQALALDADCSSAIVLLAHVRAAEHDGKGARADLAAAIEKKPNDAVLRLALGEMLFTQRDWAGADAQYTKVLESDPRNGAARLSQTIARQWLKAPVPELEKGFLDAAKLLPDADRPLQCLVDLHPKERDKKLALLKKVIAENPKAAAARAWIADILRKEAPVDWKGATAMLREAEQLAPTNARVHSTLAEMLEQREELAGAVEQYVRAVENSAPGGAGKESDAAYRLLHVTKGWEKIPRDVRKRAYDVIVAMNPEDGNYGNNAGFFCREAGEYAESLKYYVASVKASPDDQNFLNDTGLIYLYHFESEKDKALPLFETVLDLVRRGHEPARGYWDALENLCKYWFEKGQYKKVVEYADLRADPKASIDGRPYPSMKAADYKAKALKALGK